MIPRRLTAAPSICLALILTAASVLASLAADTEGRSGWADKRGAERFAPIDWLIGEWQGYGEFTNRTTYIHKQYYYDLAGMYLIERTIGMFPPEEISTEYEVHQDFTVFYRDTDTGGFLSKGFHVEGFVWSSDVGVSEDGNSIVIETSTVDNAPPGMRGRISYTREGDDRYTATFELAMPGRDYKLYENLVMDRVK